MSDAVLEVLARAIVEPLQAGMASAAATVTETTGEMNAAFTAAAATAAKAQASEAVAVKEATGSMMGDLERLRERLVLTGSGFKFAAYEAGSAFGAMGVLFGAGIAVHFINQLKESEVELSHLSELTGTSVAKLAEFKAAMASQGVPTDNLNKVLLRLSENMTAAAEKSGGMETHFKNLGIDTSDWARKMPPALDVLLQISDALHDTEGNAVTMGEVARVLTIRAGSGLAGGLAVGSKAIREQMEAHKGLGKAAEENVSSAEKLTRVEANLAAQMHEVMLPTLSGVSWALEKVSIGWQYQKAYALDAMEKVSAALRGNLADLTHQSDAVKKAFDEAADHMLALTVHPLPDISKLLEPPKVAPAEKPHLVEAWKEELQRMADAENEFHILSLAKQKEFWESKLALTKKGSAEQRAVEGEIRTLDRETGRQKLEEFTAQQDERIKALEKDSAQRIAIERQTAETVKKIYGEDSLEYARAQLKILEVTKSVEAAIVAEKKKADAEKKRAAEEAAREDEDHLRHQLEMNRLWLEGQNTDLKKRHDLWMINSKQLEALEKDALDKKLALDRKAIMDTMAMIDALGDPTLSAKARKKLNDELEALQAQHNDAMKKLDEKATKDRAKDWQDAIKSEGKLFDQQVKDVIRGTETMGQAVGKIWGGMATSVANILVKMAEQWLANLLLVEVLEKTSMGRRLVAFVAGETAKQAAQGTANALSVTGSAAVGAAAAFASVLETVPFPANVAMAPAVAAAEFSQIEAFAPIASAAGGWEVPAETRSTIALLHGGEKVLTPAFSRGLENLIARGGAGAGETRGPSDIHVHMGNVQALDAAGVAKVLRGQGKEFTRIIRQLVRDGSL